jgi:hypothetical protein
VVKRYNQGTKEWEKVRDCAEVPSESTDEVEV